MGETVRKPGSWESAGGIPLKQGSVPKRLRTAGGALRQPEVGPSRRKYVPPPPPSLVFCCFRFIAVYVAEEMSPGESPKLRGA